MSRHFLGSVLGLTVLLSLPAQVFDAGSNGSDGPLNLSSPGTVLFDPESFHPRLNPAGDSVYHFTSIYIGPGVVVKLSAKRLRGPIFWLAQGLVDIEGTIDLSGDDSASYASGSKRIPTFGGAGGNGGGLGDWNGQLAEMGDGKGSGPVNRGGTFTGNIFLVPLVGGSGGGGSHAASGGGGGGAILIASSNAIIVNGTINADGGNQSNHGFPATGGSGGAIRLIAPLINGSGGAITARGGTASGGLYSGSNGRVRLEAFVNNLATNLNGTPVAVGKPFKVFLPPGGSPSLRVTSVGGIPVNHSISEESNLPARVHLLSSHPETIRIEGRGIPPGSTVILRLFSADGINQDIRSTPLQGKEELSTATASVVFPAGTTCVFVKGISQPTRGEKPGPDLAHPISLR